MRDFISNTLLFIVVLAVFLAAMLAFLHPQELSTVEGWKKFLETGEIGQYQFEWRSLLRSGAFLGSVIAGSIVGAIPLLTGAVKNKLFMGLTGFLICVGSGIIGGLLLGIPMMGILTFWIFREAEKDKQEIEELGTLYQEGQGLDLSGKTKS